MGCTNGIAKNITSSCETQPVAGLEAVVYAWKRGDITATYDGTNPNKVTGLAQVGSAVAYKITGFKKNLNAGHDIVVAEDSADTYKHYFSLKGYESLTADVANFDALGDLCVVVEYKQKSTSGDGIFVGYGFKSGLFKSTDTRRANDANGTRNIELTSQDGQAEPYSQYNILLTDYATTKAALEGLLS